MLSPSKREGRAAGEWGGRLSAYVYILRCRDGSYYVGSTRGRLERRIAKHDDGTYGGWTKARRPVELMFHQAFDRIADAIAAERQLKGWSRAKKEALMRGDFERLRVLARPRGGPPHPSTGSG